MTSLCLPKVLVLKNVSIDGDDPSHTKVATLKTEIPGLARNLGKLKTKGENDVTVLAKGACPQERIYRR